MLFEVIEELKDKIRRLEKAKTSAGDLERYGLGKDVLCMTHIGDESPKKDSFQTEERRGSRRKVKFPAGFSIATRM